eukprot:Phypoly_transcript_10748.p2 GENE.Phypoly_transcript_10748~~Phypoly_transcript_10748.p2  ORF type:complete len:270 (+),score=64.90 Phypoly_transcript_10748:438-1247(+)
MRRGREERGREERVQSDVRRVREDREGQADARRGRDERNGGQGDTREEIFRNFNKRGERGREGGREWGGREGGREEGREGGRWREDRAPGDLRNVIRGNKHMEEMPFVDPNDRWGAPRSEEPRTFRGRGPRGGRGGGMRSGGGGREQEEQRDTTYDYIIPRSDRYFEHDDRGEMPIRRGGGRRGGRGGFRRDFRDRERAWKHDLFEDEKEEGDTKDDSRNSRRTEEGRKGGERDEREEREEGEERVVKSLQEEMGDREEFEEEGGEELL